MKTPYCYEWSNGMLSPIDDPLEPPDTDPPYPGLPHPHNDLLHLYGLDTVDLGPSGSVSLYIGSGEGERFLPYGYACAYDMNGSMSYVYCVSFADLHSYLIHAAPMIALFQREPIGNLADRLIVGAEDLKRNTLEREYMLPVMVVPVKPEPEPEPEDDNTIQ